MPRNTGEVLKIEEGPASERERCFQRRWYEFGKRWVSGRNVIDVGAGNGGGMDILKQGNPSIIYGIDPGPLRNDVFRHDISTIASASREVVFCIDVIEHIEDDLEFFEHLLRVASELVFFTTPNHDHSKCTNKYHVREYTPCELTHLLGDDLLRCEFYTDFTDGHIEQIEHPLNANTNFGVLIHVR